MNDIVILEGNGQSVEEQLEPETGRLTRRRMADLFAAILENILVHLKHIFRDNELETMVTAKVISLAFCPRVTNNAFCGNPVAIV